MTNVCRSVFVNYFELRSDYNVVNVIYLILAPLGGQCTSSPPDFVNLESRVGALMCLSRKPDVPRRCHRSC